MSGEDVVDEARVGAVLSESSSDFEEVVVDDADLDCMSGAL